jgi:hypothetical protein
MFGDDLDGRKESVMGDQKSKKKTDKPVRDEFVVRGNNVVITRQGDREVLQIDGRIEEFFSTVDGYLLKRDVFQHPAKSLREAAERFLEHETAP